MRIRCRLLFWTTLCWFAAPLATNAFGQLNVRPDDDSGLSLRLPRVRVIHSDRPQVPGTSMHLQQTDPWLAYAMGYALFEREWSPGEGLFRDFLNQKPLLHAEANSCAMCHNLPFRTPGCGGNVAHPGGYGRNIPHLFGIGLVETIGLQVRQQILRKYDLNRNGFLDVPGETRDKEAVIEASPGVVVNFGVLDDRDGDGLPGLNDVLRTIVVGRDGKPLVDDKGAPSSLQDPRAAGYDLVMANLLSAREIEQGTLRVFADGVLGIILGLPLSDQTSGNNTGRNGDERADDAWGAVSNAGARQLYFPASDTLVARCHGISEGEIDLLEWFLHNDPRPARRTQTSETKRGRRLLRDWQCTSCHVERWDILPADAKTGMPGDRRFFDLDVADNDGDGRLEGRLRLLADPVSGPDGSTLWRPRRGGFRVDGIYSDMAHHDVGERFYEYGLIDGRLFATKRFRTTPLWGVGSTAPYGHDGRSLALDDVIRRHGGEARQAAEAYKNGSPADRQAVLAYLNSLVLFQPDVLPTDLNGDGRVDQEYLAQGLPVGPELFRPEFLFRVAPRYRGWVADASAGRRFSYELLNAQQAYGRFLEGLRDSDSDGIPDLSSCSGTASGLFGTGGGVPEH